MAPPNRLRPSPASRARIGRLLALATTLCLTGASLGAITVLEGSVPENTEAYFSIPFEVPAGTREVFIRHADLSDANILDWGLKDPQAFRGWGGGSEESILVGEQAASRGYTSGPLPPGTWEVIVGKARIDRTPAPYRIEIELRAEPTLPAQARSAYVHVPALSTERRWYSGDFHVHSKESGDATARFEDIASLASALRLDFVALTDHNTPSTLQLLPQVQKDFPSLLWVPSVELTTYAGHATAVGATSWVDFRWGQGDASLSSAVEAFAEQGALFTIAHPVLDLGSSCIGCPWEHEIPKGLVAIEIASGGWEQSGVIFTLPAIAYWDRLSRKGLHVTALAGSDDHRGGHPNNQTASSVGSPTTLVQAAELSVPALLQAIREGRTVVKLQGPGDAFAELNTTNERHGDTAVGERISISIRTSQAYGHELRLLKNAEVQERWRLDSPQHEELLELTPPDVGEDFWRVELWKDDRPVTVTSNLWVARIYPAARSPKALTEARPSGCGCQGSLPGSFAWAILFAWSSRRIGRYSSKSQS